MALPAVIGAAAARLAPILARGGTLARGGAAAVGLGSKKAAVEFVGKEALKYGALLPLFYATGVANPNRGKAAAPMPGAGAISLQDQVLYGDPGKSGLFGSQSPWLGGRRREKGLLERQFESESKYKKSLIQAQLQGATMGQATNRYLGGLQTERDIMSARLNNASNTGANIASIIGGRGINNPARYATPIQLPPTQQISSYGDSYYPQNSYYRRRRFY